MAVRIPAKLLLGQAHQLIGNEEDIIVVARGSKGVHVYSNMPQQKITELWGCVELLLCHYPEGDKPDA